MPEMTKEEKAAYLNSEVDKIRNDVKVWLSDHHIFSADTDVNKVFALIEKDFLSNTDSPSEYAKKLWTAYKALPKEFQNNTTNGNIFEAIVITALLKAGIKPIYTQTNLVFVPNVNYDIVVFPKKDGVVDVYAPIVISLKTSLRERYKQADLEGIVMKNVYNRGESYLITRDKKRTINNEKEKIVRKEIRGLDDFISAESTAFDEFVANLQGKTVGEPPQIKVIEKSHTIE